jgi:hypothetical protein
MRQMAGAYQKEMTVMQQALRPYVTAGVALVGASLIAVTPVTTPSLGLPDVRMPAIQLTAADPLLDIVNPLSPLEADVTSGFSTLEADVTSGFSTLEADVTSGLPAATGDSDILIRILTELLPKGTLDTDLTMLFRLETAAFTDVVNQLKNISGVLNTQLGNIVTALGSGGTLATALGSGGTLATALGSGGTLATDLNGISQSFGNDFAQLYGLLSKGLIDPYTHISYLSEGLIDPSTHVSYLAEILAALTTSAG